jgi:Flp pilus assembly pilin Flp
MARLCGLTSFMVICEVKLMKSVRAMHNYFLDSEGQTLVEYVFILVLVAVVVFLMVTAIGGTTNNYYSSMNNSFTGR